MTNANEITGHELDILIEKNAELMHQTIKGFASNFTEQEKEALTQVAKESTLFREKVTNAWDDVEVLSEFDRATTVLMYEYAFIHILEDEQRAQEEQKENALCNEIDEAAKK